MKAGFRQGVLIFSWGLYDLANQFFTINIATLYFVRWLTLEKGAPEIFFSIAFGVSTFLVAVLTPVLGTISDIANRRMPFLNSLTLISVVFTMMLGIKENVILALAFFAIANFGCQAAAVFYNAVLVDIAPENKIGFVSGLGRTLAYIGAILSLFIAKPIVLKYGYKALFVPTGLLFLIFAAPCMLLVKDKKDSSPLAMGFFLGREKLKAIFKKLAISYLNCFRMQGLSDFLKAIFFGLCAINVIMLFMSVYITKVFKLQEAQITNLVLFSSFFAVAGSMLSGIISDYIGYRRGLCVTFFLWIISISLGAFARNNNVYWLIGGLVGFTLGATWVLSRALILKLMPKELAGEIFSLFNLVGYASTIAGGIFWGLITLLLSPLGEMGYRIAMLCLTLFMVLGFVFLLRIKEDGKWIQRS